MIYKGDKLPSVTFQHKNGSDMNNLTTEDVFAGKKVVLFAVPGAFTPTCSESHLPGFVASADKIKEKGIDEIICTSVNDAFVLDAWGKALNAEHIMMIADGAADFAKALGLDADTGSFGGIRSRRYSMLVDDGIVKELNIEEPKQFEVSDAETMLKQIG
ncbi:peroxiredoxin [Flocculibacter collagenilyticus]|uniref:peroxiredoxin n=1 Tax=Flocculibacter collagenilyticus TaxID=2744479 RepID=UPI0018F283D3|nr:peroxiredoxin [Flocculibacter collagenilyticus]